MSVVVIGPAVHGIDLDTVRAHLRVDDVEDEDLIDAYVSAAVAHISGPGGWLDGSIWQQTLELRQDELSGSVRLPYGPVTSVLSVKTVDANGVEQTVSAADYILTAGGEIALAHGASWPTLRGDTDGVRIRYEVGFATLPPAALTAVLLMVGDLYQNRETTGPDGGAIQMSTTVRNLLSPFKAWSV